VKRRGVSPANAGKIFLPFFTTHREDGGTALGLGIVKSLLSAYHGEIGLEDAADADRFLGLSIPRISSI
jgi:signal transduction histidine kinase